MTATDLSQESLEVFYLYAEDAINWSFNPWVSIGNVDCTAKMRGNLTDLVKKGYIKIGVSNCETYIDFTQRGIDLAYDLGFDWGQK